MKKEKTVYRFSRYMGNVIQAKKEIPFEIKLSSRLLLDELCFRWNKRRLVAQINQSLEDGDRETFEQLSEEYKQYIWEWE